MANNFPLSKHLKWYNNIDKNAILSSIAFFLWHTDNVGPYRVARSVIKVITLLYSEFKREFLCQDLSPYFIILGYKCSGQPNGKKAGVRYSLWWEIMVDGSLPLCYLSHKATQYPNKKFIRTCAEWNIISYGRHFIYLYGDLQLEPAGVNMYMNCRIH